MTQPAAVLQIVILRDGLLVGTEVFTPGKYTIGSARTAELRLDDANVEPQHGVLYFHNGRAAIQDGETRAGISVNGHRIRACEIRPQDEVHVGPFLLKVRVLAKQAAPQPASPPPEVAALLGVAPAARALHPAQTAAPQSPGSIAPPVVPVVRPRAVSHALADTAPENAPSLPATAQPVRLAQPPPAGTVPSARRIAQLAHPEVNLPTRPPNGAQGLEAASFDAASFDIDEPTAVTAPAARPAPPSAAADAKDAARLNLELWWGTDRQLARSFGAQAEKAAVLGAHSDDAAFPLWGFTLPATAQGFELLQRHAGAWRLFVPPEAAVEVRRAGTNAFYPLTADRLGEEKGRRFVELAQGTAVRLSEGGMSLLAYPAPPPERMRGSLLAGIPWLVIALFLMLGGGFTTLVILAPEPHEVPDFVPRHIPPVAVKLMAPEPKKKEEAAKKLAELKEKAPAKAKQEAVPKESAPVTRRTEKRAPTPGPTQESKALKALSKLTAAGPATTDVLAAVDKMGGGPGSKKNSFKLSDMVGKDPIANAGIGSVGLGGGGGGGRGTRGIEVLQGKGGGGIGALGAKGYGSGGSVGGTVTRASARQVGAQGSIDRDAVAKVINANLQAVRGCYERALLKEPGLAGKAVLEWSINTQGAVTTAKTKSSTLRNAEVESCILRSIKTWKFPAAKGGQVIVTYPFVFNSVGY